jgi:Protein of unknown function (DUF1697)
MSSPRRHVAFFRNLNVGQRGSPTRDQLLAAFTTAGARDVVSFQANGTVVFRASAPIRTTELARSYLVLETPWVDVAPVRTGSWVRGLADELTRLDDGAGTSYATPTLERLLRVPVTSRSASTMLRLADRLR